MKDDKGLNETYLKIKDSGALDIVFKNLRGPEVDLVESVISQYAGYVSSIIEMVGEIENDSELRKEFEEMTK